MLYFVQFSTTNVIYLEMNGAMFMFVFLAGVFLAMFLGGLFGEYFKVEVC